MKVCKEIIKTFEEEIEETIETWVEKVEEVCEDLPWPLDWFCDLVTFFIKVIVVVVTTIIKVVITVYCYVIAGALALLGEILNILMAIPIVGPLIKSFLGALAWLWSQYVGLLDAGLGLIGVRPIKHLRLHIIILMRDDRTLTVPPDRIALVVQRTESIFRARADVKIHTTIHQVSTPSPRNALYVDSGVGLLGEDLTGAGLYFQWTITEMLVEQGFWFAIKIGAPIVAFIVDGVGSNTEQGCSSGPLADYVCIEGGQMIVPPQNAPVTAPIPAQPAGATMNQASDVLAHEMGHACGLLHDNPTDCASGDVTNLMYCNSFGPAPARVPRGDNLSPFQRGIVRSSPHVTYL